MMFTQSVWNSFSAQTDFPTLTSGAEADVAIIGGGITGITLARLLAENGKKTVVLEARKVGGGTTAHSTGNLYVNTDHLLSSLQSKYDLETVKKIIAGRKKALDMINSNVAHLKLDCDYRPCNWYLFSASDSNNQKISDELELIRSADELAKDATGEIPVHATSAMKMEGQAQFNPLRYVQELAKTLDTALCRIYENTRVTEVENEDDYFVVRTEKGTVKADYVVHATHTPKGVMVYHTLLGPYREYGVAGKLRNTFPEGIFWGYYGSGSKFSFRSYSRGGENLIMAIGKPHKVGQENDNTKEINELERYLKEHFDVSEITHRWGGQHYRPADHLPYIGRRKSGSNEFVATGFSTDGLVYGTLSAMIITDHILERENPWAGLFDSTRHQPMKAAKEFIKENINVGLQYLKDLPWKSEVAEFTDVPLGEGRVVRKENHQLAVYRTMEGEFIIKSAACTHMDCIVNWNKAEKTWDCPCHGTRFSCDGSVMEGPAFHPLDDIWMSGKSEDVERKKKE